MDLERVFRMKEGTSSTSYARNSFLQKKAAEEVVYDTLEAIKRVFLELTPKTMIIADLGCSSGTNTLSIAKDMVKTVSETAKLISCQSLEFLVCLNDLPTNDFNTIYNALPDFENDLQKELEHIGYTYVQFANYPRSFYGSLFQDNFVHFIYSSNSLHWLSKVPPELYNEKGESINEGNVYISKFSTPAVSQAYFNQFQEDFSLFLRSRYTELLPGGQMVLIFLGRIGVDHVDRGNSFFWELLTQSLVTMVSKGEIEKGKFNSYHAAFYAPSKDEIEELVNRNGSFKVQKLQMFQIEKKHHQDNEISYGTAIAKTVRAIQEPILIHHFGIEERALDTLFEVYGRLVDEEMAKEEIKPVTFSLVLRKFKDIEVVDEAPVLTSN